MAHAGAHLAARSGKLKRRDRLTQHGDAILRRAANRATIRGVSESGLPDDLDALKAMIAARDAEIATLSSELADARSVINDLKIKLARARRMQFGAKSEKLDRLIEQLELGLGDLEEDAAESCAHTAPATRAAEDKRAPARRPLPAHLPREIIEHTTPCACPRCGGKLSRIGEDVCEVLEYVPGRFKAIRHVRPKFSCRSCETIHQPPAPSLPIGRGRPGPKLLAHVLVSKYCDHLPLYRQSDIYARDGVDLERSTLADWVGSSAALLKPLAAAIAHHAMAGPTLHADDTPVRVLDPGRGKTREGRFWVYVRDERPCAGEAAPAVAYFYSSDRKGEHPRAHLADFRGVLHADGYAGFDRLFIGGRMSEAPCMAHVRRKFFDIAATNPSPIATEALQRIAALYEVEAEARGQPPDRRRAIRQHKAKPLFVSFMTWLEATRARLSAKTDLAKAIFYALARKDALARYLDDGRIEIDNSPAERALRGVALGRKNYLFAGSDAGGARAAIIYTLIETAKLNDVDPQAWLADVLARIADHPINRIEEFLPWRWARPCANLAA